MIRIWVDQHSYDVPDGITVVAALQYTGCETTRTSVTGEPRAPLCGMGVCHECRLDINGVRRLGCQTTVHENMHIQRVCNEPDPP